MAAGFAGYTYVMTPGNFTVQTDSTAFADGKMTMVELEGDKPLIGGT